MKQLNRYFFWLPLLCLLVLSANQMVGQPLDMSKFKGIKARSIGPAGMSGRVTAIDGLHGNPNIFFVGTASGGLWKTTSGGIAWEALFDEQKVTSIGALAVSQQNPDLIWVGTGEGNPRNSQTNGNGVYKSTDGGKTWQHLGLDKTRNIHRIIIHRDDPNTVFVGAIGDAWADSPDRGVYKTTDGGKTWEKILYTNERTGVADMVLDPLNPNKIIVAMWEYRRWPWFFKSGGAGSGLYVTTDGGKTWSQRTHADGLPEGELGRIGLAIARSKPEVVYALVESKKNALYRSDDGGRKWAKVADKDIGDRPFYYAELYVDPSNENRIFNLYSLVSMSEDGGKTFKVILPYSGTQGIHPDHHALYIDPKNPDFIVNGNDGGLAISRDRGKNWQFVDNLPLGQFYHINVDMAIPYHVYGGLQDNGSWRGPAYEWREGGIRNSSWELVSFGDGFDVVPDPTDSRYGYSMSQGGNLYRYDNFTGHTKFIKPVHPEGRPLRFNWNAAIALDPFDGRTVYYGSQFVHKSTDRGDNWQIISPDLTTNDPEKQKQDTSGGLTFDATNAENHTTILAIEPSPVQQGVIWVGTDDGNLQLTTDGGKTWNNLTANLKGVPAGSWIPQIRASKHQAGEAYVIVNNYRRGDWKPYAFKTTDFGKTWQNIATESQVWGYTLSIVQDPVAPNLLFLGTEFGLYVSVDGGKNWAQFKEGYPTASTMDLVIHPREHDLVVGTFGRAIYVVDDIRPFREVALKGASLLNRSLAAFPTPDAWLAEYRSPAGVLFAGNGTYEGENRPAGAMLSFYLKELKAKQGAAQAKKPETDTLQVQIADQGGVVIRNLKVPAKEGLNRFQWDLRQKGVRSPQQPKPKPGADEPAGMYVLPGNFQVRFIYHTDTASTMLTVHADPRMAHHDGDLQALAALQKELMNQTETVTNAMDRLREAKEAMGNVTKLLGERTDESAKLLRQRHKEVTEGLDGLMYQVVPKENIQGILRNPNILSARLNQVRGYLSSEPYAPTETHRTILRQTAGEVQKFTAQVDAFFNKEWKEYRELAEKANLSPFPANSEK